MLNTVTTTIGTAAVVGVSQVIGTQKFDIKQVIGVAMVALFLAAMNEVNVPLAEGFGTLIFVSALYLYGPAIAKGLKLTK